jgi:amino acid transporter/mannitol/fructose-specific phosphotransferase system IIA component (Ntr-type)
MEQAGLKRNLGLGHVFCIASGAMISSGLFVLPGMAFARAGPAVILGYLLAGILALPGMLSIAEMATAMPRAGADCYSVIRSMGPGVGTVAGLLSWFSLSMKAAFALIGLSVFAAAFVHVPLQVIALPCCVLFLGVNLIGVKEAAWMQVLMAVALLGILLVYVFVGIPAVQVGRFEPFAPHGVAAGAFVTGYVFISFGGLLKIASVAEEIRNPARNIPLGMIVSLLVVMLLYALVVFVTVGVLDGQQLGGSLTPVSDGAGVFMGRPGKIALSLAAVLAFLTTANAGIMTAARSLVPLSRDRLFPATFAKVHPRFGTPQHALLLTGGFIVASLFLRLEILVEAASIVLILTNVLSCLSVIILRESGVQNYRPRFRAPLYPWLQVAGLLGFGFVLIEMGVEAYLITAALAMAGFCTYWFYGRKHVRQESALLHLIERITDRDLVTGALEAELKQVIRERDEIVRDRFDHVIEACAVVDVEGRVDLEELIELAAGKLADRLDAPAPVLRDALKERERQGTTVLSSRLAVPHCILDGQGRFDILLARCQQGVAFSEDAPEVRAVFVLACTADERSFYLSALASIAQIAGDARFMDRWLNARNPQALRDIVLLGTRLRE